MVGRRGKVAKTVASEEELESLRSENLLVENLKLLQSLSESPTLSQDNPPDLHACIMDSTNFMNQLISEGCKFLFEEASATDAQTADIIIDTSSEESISWALVSDDIIPRNVIEEKSSIDNENYEILTEESVEDAFVDFIAKSVLSNPNARELTPEELHKILTKALGTGMNKMEKMWHAGTMLYTLSSWGLALVGLYRTGAVVRVAAMGVRTSSKLILKALSEDGFTTYFSSE